MQTLTHADPLVVAGVELRSRLFLGTGKYATDEAMLGALEASGCELVTVALRRLDLDNPNKKTILDVIDWHRYRILPNTAGCRTADEAIRIAHLARSMGLSDWVKLEVIPDPRYLFPDPEETLKAARILVNEGFKVLPYINADPVLARKAMELGADAVLVNTAVALAKDPALMADAIREGVNAGRKAYAAGRMPRRPDASPSSPTEGVSL